MSFVVPKTKIFESIQELVGDKPLSANDFEGFRIICVDIPKTTFTLEIPDVPAYFRGFDRVCHPEKPEMTLTKDLTTLTNVIVPRFRGGTSKDILIEFYRAHLYSDIWYEQYKPWELYYKNLDYWDYDYKISNILYEKAAIQYESIIDKILKHCVPEDRDIIKSCLLAKTVGLCAYKAVGGISCSRYFSSTLIKDFEKELDFKQRENKDVKATTDRCIHAFNIAVALFNRAKPHLQACQKYYHLQRLKGIELYNPNVGKEIIDSPNLHLRSRVVDMEEKISETRQKLFECMKKYGLIPPQMPLKDPDAIKVEIPKPILWVMHAKNNAQNLFSNLFQSLNSSAENMPLLDILSGYEPIYIVPKSTSSSSLDQDIILKEKELVESVSEALDIEELFGVIEKALKLMSFIYMRYNNSLNYNSESYFEIFESTDDANKKQYYKILEVYFKNIIVRCLYSTLTILKNTVYNKYATTVVELEKIKAITKQLQSYIHPKNVGFNSKCKNVVDKLNQTIQEFHSLDVICAVVPNEATISLRKRSRNIVRVTTSTG